MAMITTYTLSLQHKTNRTLVGKPFSSFVFAQAIHILECQRTWQSNLSYRALPFQTMPDQHPYHTIPSPPYHAIPFPARAPQPSNLLHGLIVMIDCHPPADHSPQFFIRMPHSCQMLKSRCLALPRSAAWLYCPAPMPPYC